MKLIMLGPQASGKGTQADMLSDELGIPHISTGDILRQNIRNLTDLGKTALEYINKGELVPDEVINQVIAKRLQAADCIEGYILDGYPRNIGQADSLTGVAEIDYAIEITLSDQEAIQRISGRRTCDKCGAVFSIFQAKEDDLVGVCSKCGGRLIIRDDDKTEAVRKRLQIYHDETEPLVEYYKEKKKLLRINGARPIDVIYKEILKKIS